MQKTLKQPPKAWQKHIDNWLEYLRSANYSEQSIQSRRYKAIHMAKWLELDPLDVSTKDLVKFLSQPGYKPETRKAYKNTAVSFFTYLQRSGVREDNPTLDLPRMRRSHAHPHPCPDKYIIAALAKANEKERIMIQLGAECGLRRSEIACIHSRDVIDFPEGKSLIVHGKGDKERIVPLPENLARVIVCTNGYLFPGRWTGHVEASYVGKHVSGLLPKGWSAHSLRHRYATTIWAATHDLLLVSTLLGHESVETTQMYVAMPQERLRAAVDAVKLQK